MDTVMDELTGLPNRTALLESIDRLCAHALQENSRVIILFIDLDHLKSLNDTYGHNAGDHYIKQIATWLHTHLSSAKYFGRYGGDEFLAAIPTMDVTRSFEEINTLHHNFSQASFSLLSNENEIHKPGAVSIGMAIYPSDGIGTLEIIEKAKEAMYRAKTNGGNRIAIYTEKDGLTGVLNAVSFSQQMEHVLSSSQKERQTLTIAALDIDHFMAINSQYGHRTGDEVLKKLGNILLANFPESSIIGRIGGDEFVVLLPGTRIDTGFILFEEVRKLIEDTEIKVQIGKQTHSVQFTITCGIASFPDDATDRIDLLRKADEALYRAKRMGRNRVFLPANTQMSTKTSYYTQVQLERLAELAKKTERTEAFLLREALDDLLRKYDEK